MRPARPTRTSLIALLATIAIAWIAPSPAPAAKDKTAKMDLIWARPDFDSLGVQSVALLPAVSFDNNRPNELSVESIVQQQVHPSGYRWIAAQVSKEMIRSALGESTFTATRQAILKTGRVDSLTAPRLCRALRIGAVMSVRMDLFEKIEVEWNQSGKPSTTVSLRAALVDSTGRLLWTASGSETGEGTYHEADAGTMGVKGSGLTTTPITAQSGAPSYDEVTTRLLARWMLRFPARSPKP